MLVLTRKVNEEILIGDNIRIKIVDIGAGRIRIGISAPRDVTVLRDEVIRDFDRPAVENVSVPASVEACSVEPCTSV
jgi:carbon storage regulator CsrA